MPSLINSIDRALALDFRRICGGDTVSLVQGKIQYYRDYVNDLREKAMAAINEVNRTEVIQGINGTNAITEAYFNALTKLCSDRINVE